MKFDIFKTFFMCMGIALTLGIICFILGMHYSKIYTEPELSKPYDSQEVYMICDVTDVRWHDDYASIDIELPSGYIYTINKSYSSDIPDEFSEVVIHSNDLDDVSTYSIVGLR